MIKIREATAEDIPETFKIRVATKENVLTEDDLWKSGITPQAVEKLLQTCCKCWVTEYDHRVVGFCTANAETKSIWALFIYPEYEGRGLGRLLMEAAVDWLWSKGTDQIWLTTETNTRADGFYRHLGWQRGETVYEDGIEDVRYTLKRPSRVTP